MANPPTPAELLKQAAQRAAAVRQAARDAAAKAYQAPPTTPAPAPKQG